MPGNLFIQARQTTPEAELKKQLIEMCKAQDREFGLIVRKLDFPSSGSREDLQNIFSGQSEQERPTSIPLAVYKVFVADGHHYFNRPGPRLLDSAEILAEILHPELCNYGHRGHGWEPL